MKLTKKTIVGGAILLAGAYLIYRYFKSPKKDDISTTSTPDAPSSSLPNPTTTPAKPTTTTTDQNKGRIDLAKKIVADYKKVMSNPNAGLYANTKTQIVVGSIGSNGTITNQKNTIINSQQPVLVGNADFVIENNGFISARTKNNYYRFSPYAVEVKQTKPYPIAYGGGGSFF